MLDKLKEIGLKATRQRLAILKILEGNTSHPSAEEIYEQLKEDYSSLSLTTVYNTLDILARHNIIQEIGIDAKCRRFDPNPAPHHHFQCKDCGRVYDLDFNIPNLDDVQVVNGFEIHVLQTYSYGLCPNCRK